MSGEAGGLILIPIALMAMPALLGGLAVIGVTAAAVKAGSAAVKYEKEQRKRRQTVRSSASTSNKGVKSTNSTKTVKSTPAGTQNTGAGKLSAGSKESAEDSRAAEMTFEKIGSFRKTMEEEMEKQTSLNISASEQMLKELELQREAFKRIADQQDTQAFNEYVSKLRESRTGTMDNIVKTQNEFNVSYRQAISESLGEISGRINSQYNSYMDELTKLKSDMAEKNQRAQEIAKTYIDEARTLLTALDEDFEGRKFSLRQLASLEEQFNQAVAQYNKGHFESAIASVKDVAVNTLEEIYEADAKKQEWENYYKLALVLSEEVKTFIESQGTITKEIKEYAENSSGKKLEEEIVGINVSDYTEKNSKGQTKYAFVLKKAEDIYTALRTTEANNLTTEQLKSYVGYLNNELYPAAASCINKGIINMNNAFSRQNIGEELIDFFEEHNFMFNGYAYEDDRHDKALHIGLENEASGEELIITLCPELVGNGDIQTRVDLKQIKGDEANEERKAYYRKCVEEVVKGNNPYAQVSLKCNEATRNRLSADTETKKKLKNP